MHFSNTTFLFGARPFASLPGFPKEKLLSCCGRVSILSRRSGFARPDFPNQSFYLLLQERYCWVQLQQFPLPRHHHHQGTKGSQYNRSKTSTRSSSREVRIRVVVYLSRGPLPQKKGKRALLEELVYTLGYPQFTASHGMSGSINRLGLSSRLHPARGRFRRERGGISRINLSLKVTPMGPERLGRNLATTATYSYLYRIWKTSTISMDNSRKT